MYKNLSIEIIAKKIFLIRGQKVMLDKDLAELYGVSTKALIQSVKRNRDRFPEDFMFELRSEEFQNLRSQIVTSSWGGRRYMPYVFTEQGVAMLSSVLRSERAVQVNIAIMRTFVRLREILATHKELTEKLKELEERVGQHDSNICVIFEAIKQLMRPSQSEEPKPKIGFHH